MPKEPEAKPQRRKLTLGDLKSVYEAQKKADAPDIAPATEQAPEGGLVR